MFYALPVSAVSLPHARPHALRLLAGMCLWACSAWAFAATEPSMDYTVKAQDKLIILSGQLLTQPSDWTEVARVNALKNPNLIHPGQVLQIPLRLMSARMASAQLVSTQGDVQIAGQAATGTSSVSEGSEIQTGANSSAVLQLADGSRVTLLPNTLAALASSRHYAGRDASASGSTGWFSGLIRLSQGALQTLASKNQARATPLQIQTPTALVGVRGTEFRVAHGQVGQPLSRTEVLTGAVRADNRPQADSSATIHAELAAGQGALIDPTQPVIRVQNLPLAPDLSSVATDILKPEALWQLPPLRPGSAAYRVQIASDAAFHKILHDLLLPNADATLPMLPNGRWFARVREVLPNGLEGYDSVREVQVVQPPPPAPIPKPPLQWQLHNDKLHIGAGRALLEFSQEGLDTSHTLTATVTTNEPPYTRLHQVTAVGSSAPIFMALGPLLPAGNAVQVHFTVTQADGALVVPLSYRLQMPGNASLGWVQGVLQRIESPSLPEAAAEAAKP